MDERGLVQLQREYRAKAEEIVRLQESTRVRKEQLVRLSAAASALIEKKGQIVRPNYAFNPEYATEALQEMETERQALYRDIEYLKDGIAEIKSTHREDITLRVHAKAAHAKLLQAKIQAVASEKEMIKKKCDDNKDVLRQYEQRGLAKQIDQLSRQLSALQGQRKTLQVSVKGMTESHILLNLYYAELERRMQGERRKMEMPVSSREGINSVLGQLHRIKEVKEKERKQFQSEVYDMQRRIQNEEEVKRQLQLAVREKMLAERQEHSKIQKQEQSRIDRGKGMVLLPRRTVHSLSTEKAFKRENVVTIGPWSEGGSAKVLTNAHSQFTRKRQIVTLLELYLSGGVLSGVRCMYRRNENHFTGSKLLVSHLPTYDQLHFDLDQMRSLFYDLGALYLRFQPKSGAAVEIGKRVEGNPLKEIDFTLQSITDVELLMEISPSAYSGSVIAIRLHTVGRQEPSKMHSRSYSTLISTRKKKPFIDHRLLLKKD